MKEILVLKVGTKNLMSRGRLDQDIFNEIAQQAAIVQLDGKKVLIVSSGAIQAGRERMSEMGLDTKNLTKKELAGIGARHLLNKWGEAFAYYHKEIIQFWLTYANWQDEEEKKSIKAGILNCLNNGLVPIINENDIISDSEIRFMEEGISENDRLARMIAVLLGAKAVLFLTDAGGVYEKDPRKNPKARMYKEINPYFLEGLSGISEEGRGGIETKIKEARECLNYGMKVAIAGMEPDVLIRFSRGERVGTTLGKFSKFEEKGGKAQ